MRYFCYLILIILNFILESTIFQNTEILGVKPNFTSILIISFSFMRGQLEGALIGFFSGLLIDIFFGTFLGSNALIGLIIGYSSGYFYNDFYKNNLITPFLLTFFFTMLYEIIFFVLNIFLKGYPNIFHFFKTIILLEAFYTSLVSVFVYRIFYYINIFLEKTDREKRRFY